jgi:hypothetical protein
MLVISAARRNIADELETFADRSRQKSLDVFERIPSYQCKIRISCSGTFAEARAQSVGHIGAHIRPAPNSRKMYDLYKPLRNDLRRDALIPSLRAIWAWMQHLQFREAFPEDVIVPWEIAQAPTGPRKGIYEWELAVLAKEVILNAPDTGTQDLRSWAPFSNAVNLLKNLDNAISQRYESLFKTQILVELFRHAHHQFGWQDRLIHRHVTRYLKIFSFPAMGTILQSELGIDATALYTIGLSIAGHFLKSSELELPISFSLRGITVTQLQTFLARFSADLGALRALAAERQSYDQDFIYTLNPFKQYPLVRCTHQGKQKLIAPVPTYLLQRFTEGVYYEVLNRAGFNTAFGAAFQAYVGEVLSAVVTSKLSVLPEAQYAVGKDRKDSVDWIVRDQTGDMFIEVKTKRIRQDAKFALLDLRPLEAEIDKLADIVAQTYTTLADALAGHYKHWKPSERPFYPVIVTLEEWYVLGPSTDQMIDARLRHVFTQRGLDLTMLDEHPFTVCSVSDFERLMVIVAMRDVDTVMREKVTPKRRLWLVHTALRDAFPAEFEATRAPLFPAALNHITGE